MKTEHTAGPWRWINQGGYYDLQDLNGLVVACDGSAGDEYGRTIDPEDDGESGANARLIASAPELLKVAQIALPLVEESYSNALRLQNEATESIRREAYSIVAESFLKQSEFIRETIAAATGIKP